MTDWMIVQTSINSQEEAQKIADALVAKRLAACCWISGPIESTFWWKGAIEREQEWICSLKTRRDFYEKVEQAIKEIHTYKIPEIVALPILTGNQEFLDWVVNETADQS